MSLLLGLLSLGVGISERNRDRKAADAANAKADLAAKEERANTVRDRENMFSDLRAAANKGGFNPLTALQMTGGAGFGSGSSSSGVTGFHKAPSFASTQLIVDGFMGVGEALTSSAAHARTRNDATEKAALFGSIDQKPMKQILGANTGLRSRTMNEVHSPVRYSQPPLARPTEREIPSNVQAMEDGEFDEGHVNVVEETMTDSGQIVRVPMGPEADEIVTGSFINAYGNFKNFVANEFMHPQRDGVVIMRNGAPLNEAGREFMRNQDRDVTPVFSVPVATQHPNFSR